MAQPATVQQSYKGGMKRDGARESLPQGACWNLVDFIPESLGALCRKRGGYEYASADLGAGTFYTECGIVAEFTAGQSVLVQDANGRWYEIESPTATENIGSLVHGTRNPIFYNDLAIFPEKSGVAPPDKITRAGATHTLAVLAGSPPAGKYALVYKDVVWLGGGAAFPKRTYFSKEGDPQVWDTTVKWLDMSYPISGYAALSNAVLVFSLQRTARVRGSTPPPDSDFTVDDPVFEVGCTDNRSIVNYRDKCIFANAQGLYMTDGVALEDLTRVCGMKNWWRDLMKGREGFSTGTPYALNWAISGGIYDDYYFYSVFNYPAGQLVDAGMIDLTRYAWTRLSNIKSLYFFDRLYPQELFWCVATTPRLATTSDIFVPAATNELDADGASVQPYIETAFFGAEPGVKTFQTAFVTYDLTPSNLCLNPGFEVDTAGWVVNGSATFVRSTAQKRSGAASGLLTPTVDNTTSRVIYNFYATPFVQGVVYTARVWIYAEGTMVGKPQNVLLYEQGGASAAESTASVNPPLLAGWNEYVVSGPIKKTDRTLLSLYLGGNPGYLWVAATDKMWVDDVSITAEPRLRVGVSSEPEAATYTDLVPDLAVTTAHLRRHLEINRPGLGIAFKLQQIGHSTDTRLHEIEIAAGPRERSR